MPCSALQPLSKPGRPQYRTCIVTQYLAGRFQESGTKEKAPDFPERADKTLRSRHGQGFRFSDQTADIEIWRLIAGTFSAPVR